VFNTSLLYPIQCFYLLNYKIWACYKTKIRDGHEQRERTVDEWDKLDQCIIDKVVEEMAKKTTSSCGCRRRTVLEKKTRTFIVADILSCYFWRVDSLFAGWLKFALCATMRNSISTELYKKIFNRLTQGFFGKLEYFLTNFMIQFLLKSVHIWKSYSKKQRGSDFMEHSVLCQ